MTSNELRERGRDVLNAFYFAFSEKYVMYTVFRTKLMSHLCVLLSSVSSGRTFVSTCGHISNR
jgi:hypothetical protein